MTLKIIQGNSIANQENVSSALVSYLYNLANTNQLDSSSNLVGNLYVPGTYQAYIDKLHGDYNDLIITAGKIYVPFEDAEFGRIMNLYVSSDGIGCTQTELDTITSINRMSTEGSLADQIGEAFVGNTTITSGIDLLKIRNLTALSRDLFLLCSNLTEIGIPASVREIGSQVCMSTSLNKVVVEDIYSFCGITSNSTEIFNIGSGCDLYTIQNGQQVKVIELTLPRDMSATGLFRGCKSIESISVSDGVTNIKENAFRNCSNLETVTLPSTTTIQIHGHAFYYCEKLTSINLSNVTSIAQNAFQTAKLTSIDLSNLQSAGEGVFYGMSTLKTVVLGNGMKNLSSSIFNANVKVTTVDVSNVNFSTWNTFNRHALPSWDSTCPYNLLNFANATTITNDGGCFLAMGGSATAVPQLYLPSVTKLEKNWRSQNSRVNPSLGVAVQSYIQSGSRLKVDLIYLRDLSDMETGCINGCVCQAFIINNTTPPTYHKEYFEYYSEWQQGLDDIYVDTFGNIENADPNKTYYTNHSSQYGSNSHYTVYNTVIAEPAIDFIYVPDSAVNTYKTATGWDRVANKIKGISELNGGVTYPTEADWEAAGKPLALIDAYM